MACFASAFALAASVLLGHAHRSPFAELGDLIGTALGLVSESLPNSLTMLLGDEDSPTSGASPLAAASHGKLTRRLRQTIQRMSPVYARVRLIVFRSKVSPSAIGGLVEELQKISRNPLLSSSSHIPGERIQSALRRHNAFGSSRPQSGPGTPRTSVRLRDINGSNSRRPEQRTSAPRSLLSASRLGEALAQFDTENESAAASELTLNVQNDDSIHSACLAASGSVAEVLATIQLQLADACGWTPRLHLPLDVALGRAATKEALAKALHGLQSTLSVLLEKSGTILGKESLSSLGRSLGCEASRRVHFSYNAFEDRNRDHFRLAFYLVSLVDLAKDVQRLAATVETITASSGQQAWRLPLALSPSTWLTSDLLSFPNTDEQNDSKFKPSCVI